MCTFSSCLRFGATHSCCWHAVQKVASSPVKRNTEAKTKTTYFHGFRISRQKGEHGCYSFWKEAPDPAFQIHFFWDNHRLYSKHHFLFRNASLAETLPSPVCRPVISPTQIVFNRSFGVRDFSCLNLGIRDFKEKSGRDLGLKLSREVACRKKKETLGLRDCTKCGLGITGLNKPIGNSLSSQ